MQSGRITKHLFVTGGVTSSLGKGLTASSLGSLLKARGLTVTMQKLDPYLNVDPGTMNPFQHGEVFVTEDGAETDLDIGHYCLGSVPNVPRDASINSMSITRAPAIGACDSASTTCPAMRASPPAGMTGTWESVSDRSETARKMVAIHGV